MRLGFALPQGGGVANGEAVRAVATRAEALGYDSLWVLDRLLSPTTPKMKYGATADGKLPQYAENTVDPIVDLTFAAAVTKKARLGTSVLNLAWYNPTLLARSLASLDALSGGRLDIGIGAGWSPDEYEAVGVDMQYRLSRMAESVEAITSLWKDGPRGHKGKFYTIPETLTLKPVQRPHPPIYMAAFQPKAMKLCAEKTDGWMPTGVPVPAVKQMSDGIRGMVQAAGRDPAKFKVIYRANVFLSKEPAQGERRSFTGSLAQIAEDIHALRATGVYEAFFDIQMTPAVPSLQEYLETAEALFKASRG